VTYNDDDDDGVCSHGMPRPAPAPAQNEARSDLLRKELARQVQLKGSHEQAQRQVSECVCVCVCVCVLLSVDVFQCNPAAAYTEPVPL